MPLAITFLLDWFWAESLVGKIFFKLDDVELDDIELDDIELDNIGLDDILNGN